ncbi:urea amidolyase associated protein UAAP1 [Altericroceibacterium xinjiangense]|uniref:urea amidolyase associated protein UAAP1 n=1 Tax=Altericroceibacterium xinjiangense TaxID=762261 RepID=UPI000F7F5F99|nr:urea amidolyase associated protein UAAP1 [Altericroceibacterium xinjiangense]
MSFSTADPYGARDHARAMAGTHVLTMPTLPASEAADRPGGVPSEAMVWEEVIAGGGYAAKRIGRGARLRLTDLEGDACVSMLLFNAEQPTERLNVADTLKVQWNAYLGTGQLLLSDMGRVMMSIVEDEAGSHDALCGASNERGNDAKYGSGANYGEAPNARDRFKIAVAKFGLGAKDIHPCINWFKGVRVGPDGETELGRAPAPASRSLTLRAEMDLIVVFANCPHVLDARSDYTVTPVRVTAWRGEVTPTDDPVRNATPEGQRAFLNTEDYFCR